MVPHFFVDRYDLSRMNENPTPRIRVNELLLIVPEVLEAKAGEVQTLRPSQDLQLDVLLTICHLLLDFGLEFFGCYRT